MITGGLVNVVPVPKRRNQFTRLPPERIVTTHGPVHGYIARDTHDLWLHYVSGTREYIGCYRSESFTPEQIVETATEFAATVVPH